MGVHSARIGCSCAGWTGMQQADTHFVFLSIRPEFSEVYYG